MADDPFADATIVSRPGSGGGDAFADAAVVSRPNALANDTGRKFLQRSLEGLGSDVTTAWRGQPPASAEHGTLFPLATGPDGLSRVAVPNLARDLIGVVGQFGRAAQGQGDPNRAALDAALAITGGSVANRAAPVARGVAGAVERAAAQGAEHTPSRADIGTMTDLAYKEAQRSGVTAPADLFNAMLDEIPDVLTNNGVRMSPKIHAQASDLMDHLERYRGGDQSLKDLDILQREADAFVRKAQAAADRGEGKSDLMAATIIADKIDEFVTQTLPAKLQERGLSAEGVASLSKGRELAARGRKLDIISDIMEQAADLNSPEDVKAAFRSIRKSKRQWRQFSDDEKDVITKIARTGKLDNLGRLGQSVASSLGILSWGPGRVVQAAGDTGSRVMRQGRVGQLEDTIARGGQKAPSFFERLRKTLNE